MKGRLLSILLLITGAACNDDDGPSNCILNFAILSYGNEPISKYVYYHNGTQYTEIQVYPDSDSDGILDSQPNQFMQLTFDDQGRLSEVLVTSPSSSNTQMRHVFSYDGIFYTFREISEKDGVEQRNIVLEHGIYDLPDPNSSYVTVAPDGSKLLLVYEDGNLKYLGSENSAGTHQAHDTTWVYFVEYKYDNKPNVTTDLVTRYLIGNYSLAGCKNNMIEEIFGPETGTPISREQAYTALHGKWIKSWTFLSTGRHIDFGHKCK